MTDVPASELVVEVWSVRDTGLAPAPPRFRRLPGALRHHQGSGPPWPDRATLRLVGDRLEVPGVGAWSVGEVRAALVHRGPPLRFSLAVPGSTQLLATAATESGARLLDALG